MKMNKIAVLLLLFSEILLAKDIYVKSGNSGDGTKISPYATIDDGLRNAYSGDVIHVAKGTYFGAGGSGLFVIDKPDITLVGGYTDNFSQRNPFKNITRLMRGAQGDPKDCANTPRCGDLIKRQNIPVTKASYNPDGILKDKGATNFILDGFVIDGYTRNFYKDNNDLSLAKGPIGTACISFYSQGVKIRNSIVMNCAGAGISLNASGTKLDKSDKRESGDDWSEISNNFVFNTLMNNLDLRVGTLDAKNAPNGGAALIKNNTLAFTWKKYGENNNLLQGKQTRLTIKDNILAYSGYGISNGFKSSRFGRYIGNVFFQHTDGLYRYMERSNSTLVLDDVNELTADKCKKKYNCSKKSRGNTSQDPKFKVVDTYFLDKFFNQIASSQGGKVTMDDMNQIRGLFNMPLHGSAASGVQNYAPIWDPSDDWSNVLMFSEIAGKGVQENGIGGAFQTYSSQSSVTEDKNYVEMPWNKIKPRQAGVTQIATTGDKGLAIAVVLKAGSIDSGSFYLPASTGVKKGGVWEGFRDSSGGIYIYIKKGTLAYDLFMQSLQERTTIRITGSAYELSSFKVPGKISIKVDEITSDDDD